MRLPILILVHIATAHRVDLDLTATTGEGSNTSSIAATALQNSTAVVGTHGSDRGVLSRAGQGIPGKLMQRLALILAASSVLGGLLPDVEAKAMPTAFVAPRVPGNALSGSGFRPSATEAAGPDSGIPRASGQGSFVDDLIAKFKPDVPVTLEKIAEIKEERGPWQYKIPEEGLMAYRENNPETAARVPEYRRTRRADDKFKTTEGREREKKAAGPSDSLFNDMISKYKPDVPVPLELIAEIKEERGPWQYKIPEAGLMAYRQNNPATAKRVPEYSREKKRNKVFKKDDKPNKIEEYRESLSDLFKEVFAR